MLISDQPGRFFAVFILCPLLLVFAYLIDIKKISKKNTIFIIFLFSGIFFFYELLRILNYPSKKMIL